LILLATCSSRPALRGVVSEGLAFVLLLLLGARPALSQALPDTATGGSHGAILGQVASAPARGAIRAYQLFIADQDLPSCSFRPSCSGFSYQAYASLDPLQATAATWDRLMRCHYWSLGEYPVVEGKLQDRVADHVLWGQPRGRAGGTKGKAAVDSLGLDAAPDAVLCPESDLALADALAETGEVHAALREYVRLARLIGSPDVRRSALFRAGWILLQEDRLDEATAVLVQLVDFTRAGSPERADAELLLHLVRSTDPWGEIPTRQSGEPMEEYLSAWQSVRRLDPAAAREAFARLSTSGDVQVAEVSQASLELVMAEDWPSQSRRWVPALLSALVPGLGRVCTHRYGDAAFSFLATTGTASLAIRSARRGGAVGTWLFGLAATGFYVGNVYGSAVSPADRARQHRRAQADQVLTRAANGQLLPRQVVARRLAGRLPSRPDRGAMCGPRAQRMDWRQQGDEAFAAGRWGEAAREYRRHLHCSPQAAAADSVLFGLARALERDGWDTEAWHAYEQAVRTTPGSPLAESVRLALARLHLRDGRYFLAHLELADEIEYGTTPARVAEAKYLQTWVYLNEGRWNEARNWVAKMGESPTYSRPARVLAGELARGWPAGKSLGRARLLSAVVPGLGQTYAGRPLNGLNALTVNGAAGWLLARALRSRDWIDSGLIGGLLFYRFYVGNIHNAARFAEQHNQARQTERLAALRERVINLRPDYDPTRLE